MGIFTGVGDGWLCVAYVPLLTDQCVLPVNTAWDWLESRAANEALTKNDRNSAIVSLNYRRRFASTIAGRKFVKY